MRQPALDGAAGRTIACPITWPPNTPLPLVFGLLPANKFTSIGSRSRNRNQVSQAFGPWQPFGLGRG